MHKLAALVKHIFNVTAQLHSPNVQSIHTSRVALGAAFC
jgi:hypothetical protein